MPVDVIDLGKLIVGIALLIIPGYLWSYLFSKTITRLERLVVGFLLGVIVFSATPFLLNVFFQITLSRDLILLLFLCYLIPAVLLFFYQWYTSRKPRPVFSVHLTQKNLLLLVLLAFTIFLTFLPHLSKNYFLPFHVDEWVHWSYSRSILDYGSVSFPNPYTGEALLENAEIGFHTFTASVSWLSTSSLLSIFLFMPSILALFLGLTAFNIGEKADKKFGLEACLFISLVPTTTRYLGPSLYVAVAMGLFLLLFLVWLIQQKQYRFMVLIAPVIWCLVLIHPTSAFAAVLVVSLYCLMLALEKNKKIAVITGLSLVCTSIPFLILLLIPSRWSFAIDIFLKSVIGEQTSHPIAGIYVNFGDLGLITWAFFLIGVFYVVMREKSLQFTLCFSALSFLMIIGLFSIIGYGSAAIYERSFLYLFLFVALIAAFGTRELRDEVSILLHKYMSQHKTRYWKHLEKMIVPLIVIILLIITVVPVRLETPYYKMISEDDYEAFTWIRENIDRFRNENNSYLTAAVQPYKASPFSAITGLHIRISSMHPVLYYWNLHIEDMEAFLADQCRNTTFLDKYKITVVYGSCDNKNLTMVHPNVYLYMDPSDV